MDNNQSCLIIGAGMAGVIAAGVLRQSGWKVVLLDKGRGPGRRMATRQIATARFDHGSQFFTVRSPRFQDAVERWEACGWVKPWFEEGGHVRYRGVEGMNHIVKKLAQPLDVRTETRAERVEPAGKGWKILADSGEEFVAGSLLLTPPVAQSMSLLFGCVDKLPAGMVSRLNGIVYDPCFALLATVEGLSLVPPPGYIRPDRVRTDKGAIAFIADNTQKGISLGPAALTIHATADFTRAHFEAPYGEVAQLLLKAAEPWLGGKVLNWQLHRWKYSQPVSVCAEPCLFSLEPAPVAFAGDAFGGPRIEGAFLSGLAAAERIVAETRIEGTTL